MNYPKLENWSVVPKHVFSPYQAPETVQLAMHGNVYGRDGFTDGDEITTSTLITCNVIDGKAVVKTKSGTEYELGTVDPEYEKQFPDALARLIDAGRETAAAKARGEFK